MYNSFYPKTKQTCDAIFECPAMTILTALCLETCAYTLN